MKFSSVNKLADYVVREYVSSSRSPEITAADVSKKLQRRGASFVTVYVDGKLRGCIGNAVAAGPVWESVADNAVSAVSRDWRFDPVERKDLENLSVEVTVLTPLEPYTPENHQALLTYLSHEKPGLLIEKSGRSALFLPQVWEDLPEPESFLTELCRKAGLEDGDWKDRMTFKIFRKDTTY